MLKTTTPSQVTIKHDAALPSAEMAEHLSAHGG